MTIKSIEIKNIKGIDNKQFKLQLLPMKPNLLVAPNGFGKSSIATAFASMNSRRMDLADKDCHKEDTSLNPELTIEFDGGKLTADKGKNDIRKQFDVTVINSRLVPKAKRGFQGSVSASLEVRVIPICKIPPKSRFSYSASAAKAAFGTSGKVLPNISGLLQDIGIVSVLWEHDLPKATGERVSKKTSAVIAKINTQTGTGAHVREWVKSNCLDDFQAIEPLNGIAQDFLQYGLATDEVDAFLSAYQIIESYKSDPKVFGNAANWLSYLATKGYYDDLISQVCSSDWNWAKLNEDKKKKKLTVVFPKAHHLSNGQRDLITLIVQMHKALYEGSKKPLILIIDEVFDYLDDAKLVAFQYYVTNLIEEYKERGQAIYPVILTHLDPGVFFDFCFNKHKLQIHYLQASPSAKSKDTLKLIEARDTETAIKDRLEQYWFHFHKDDNEITESAWPNVLPTEWRKSSKFHTYTDEQMKRYLDGKKYDPLAVCFKVRVEVERQAYSLLSRIDQKDEFLNTNTTKRKLSFVANHGIEVPEIYFLLGLIYNTNLHWKQGRDYISPLVAKLNHPTIKHLVEEVAEGI